MGSTVTFKRPDGQTVQGYLAEAANARASVVARRCASFSRSSTDSSQVNR